MNDSMFKIRKVTFIDHPILKNLELDFCRPDGKAVDTVIFAGENGTGKSRIVDAIFRFTCGNGPSMEVVLEKSDGTILTCRNIQRNEYSWSKIITDSKGERVTIPNGTLCGIYSDVDINFHSHSLSTVTSLDIDADNQSRRSETDFPTKIKQLLIDIQALDDAALARAFREAKEKKTPLDQLSFENRMSRFTNAFAYMFDGLKYSRIENHSGEKTILFEKNGIDIPIDDLSSGEKQVVYRGCFMLQDINAMKGAFVFIDEPEISLHPGWQMKIMEYYKKIFTDEVGIQTSQIFTVTHSPFIIHNENRHNDKVVILARNENGDIVVSDKAEYYKCNSIEAVRDAFALDFRTQEKPTVFLEGQTDELYFNKTLEVFSLITPFQFKWVGYIDTKGQEANTGKDALNKAASFLTSRNLSVKNICLFDCDANKSPKEENNLLVKSLPHFENDKGINIGIENALVFGDINIEPYKKYKIETDGYGMQKQIPEFQKMDCCRYICSLDADRQKEIFANLKTVIEDLMQYYVT